MERTSTQIYNLTHDFTNVVDTLVDEITYQSKTKEDLNAQIETLTSQVTKLKAEVSVQSQVIRDLELIVSELEQQIKEQEDDEPNESTDK